MEIVTDWGGFVEHYTGDYPSGTSYELPNSDLATDIDAKTDQLHIGNRWIGHKGLDLYDNTARMPDPLLARLPQFFVLTHTATRTGFHLTCARHSRPTLAKNFDELASARFHPLPPSGTTIQANPPGATAPP